MLGGAFHGQCTCPSFKCPKIKKLGPIISDDVSVAFTGIIRDHKLIISMVFVFTYRSSSQLHAFF